MDGLPVCQRRRIRAGAIVRMPVAAAGTTSQGHTYPMIVEVYPDRFGGCAAPSARHRFAMGSGPKLVQRAFAGGQGVCRFPPGHGRWNRPHRSVAHRQRWPRWSIVASMPFSPRASAIPSASVSWASAREVSCLCGWPRKVTATSHCVAQRVVGSRQCFFPHELGARIAPTEIPSVGDASRYLATAGTDFSMGGTPWELSQRYVANSPLWQSDSGDLSGAFDSLGYGRV